LFNILYNPRVLVSVVHMNNNHLVHFISKVSPPPALVIFWLSVQEIIEYRFDFFMRTTKYAVMVSLMSFVWLSVGREGALALSTTQTVQYFFLGALIYSLSNFHPYEIEEDIKLGGLSKYLVRPLQPFTYHFWKQAAIAILETLVKFVVIVPLLYAMGFALHFSFSHTLFFVFYLPFIFWFSFHQLSVISLLSFWISEAWAIRWAYTSIMRLLSGMLVPVIFFPQAVQQVLFWLPYQHLAYTPIAIMQQQLSLIEALPSFGVLLVWCVLIWMLKQFVWSKGLEKFESNGG